MQLLLFYYFCFYCLYFPWDLKPGNQLSPGIRVQKLTFLNRAPKNYFQGDSTFILGAQVRHNFSSRAMYLNVMLVCSKRLARHIEQVRLILPVLHLERKQSALRIDLQATHQDKSTSTLFICQQVQLTSVSSSYSTMRQRFNFHLIQVCIRILQGLPGIYLLTKSFQGLARRVGCKTLSLPISNI